MNDFPAILLLEHRPYDRIRALDLLQEPVLLAAIRVEVRDSQETEQIKSGPLCGLLAPPEFSSTWAKNFVLRPPSDAGTGVRRGGSSTMFWSTFTRPNHRNVPTSSLL